MKTNKPLFMPSTHYQEVRGGRPRSAAPVTKECREIETVSVTLGNGETLELAILFEPGANSYFGVEASYIEQEVGAIASPYENGQLRLM